MRLGHRMVTTKVTAVVLCLLLHLPMFFTSEAGGSIIAPEKTQSSPISSPSASLPSHSDGAEHTFQAKREPDSKSNGQARSCPEGTLPAGTHCVCPPHLPSCLGSRCTRGRGRSGATSQLGQEGKRSVEGFRRECTDCSCMTREAAASKLRGVRAPPEPHTEQDTEGTPSRNSKMMRKKCANNLHL